MDALHLTTPAYDMLGLTLEATTRTVSALQRATPADLVQAIARKRMTDLERELMRKAHAMLHGDMEAADRWMEECVELLDGDKLTDRERALVELVDALAETCAA